VTVAKQSRREARIYGTVAGRSFEYVADVVGLSDSEAFFVTRSDPPHRVHVKCRYAGSVLGGRPSVTCSFSFDGEYLALAQVSALENAGWLVRPEDY
jgi:hypothetical protein